MKKIRFLKKTNSFKINALFSVIYQIVKIIVPFITSPYVSRVLGNNNIGAYSYAMSILYFFGIFSAFGFTDYGNLAISKVRNDVKKRSQKFFEIMLAKGVLTTISFLVYVPLIFSVKDFSASILLYLTIGSSLFGTLFDTTFMLMGEEEYISIALRDIFVKIITTILVFLLIKDDSYMSLIIYAGILNGSTILSGIIVIFPCKKYLIKISIRELDIKSTFFQGFVFFIPTLVSSIYLNLNKTFIGIFGGGDVENANYEQATKIINFIVTALSAINSVVISKISGIYAKYGYEEIRGKIYEIIHFVILCSMPCFAGIIIIAPFFIPVFFGPGYEGAIPIVYVLSCNVITVPLTWLLLAAFFIPTDRRKLANYVNIVAAIMDLLICIVLIPRFKGMGAGMAYSVAEIIQLVLMIFVSRKEIEWRKMFKKYFIKPFDATLIMSVPLIMISNIFKFSNSIMLIILISVGISTYFLCIFLFQEELVVKYYHIFVSKLRKLLVIRK